MLRPTVTLLAIAAAGTAVVATTVATLDVAADGRRVSAADATGKLTGRVKVTEDDGKPATADVIVYVVGFTENGGSTIATIEQKGRKFNPDLVAITAGDTVKFPNNDNLLHNVFSQSPPRKFDLGSYKQGEEKSKDFTKPGVVDVYCNIHPEMAATILVLPNKKHTRTDNQGRFSIAGIPPGDWTVFAYTRRAAKPVSSKITIKANTETTVDLTLTRGAEPPHKNKYGENYKPDGTTYPSSKK
jgi:plastocyanin